MNVPILSASEDTENRRQDDHSTAVFNIKHPFKAHVRLGASVIYNQPTHVCFQFPSGCCSEGSV